MKTRRAVCAFVMVLAVQATGGGPPARADSGAARGIVQKMIEAHGGMKRWREAPTVTFEDTWFPPGSDERTTSRVVVEQGPRRAYLDFPESGAKITWDGQRAWSVDWEQPAPPRFIALLSYYFFNLPWLTQDPGVVLGEPETATLWDDPTAYVKIRMSFEAGVGDTPDDYYDLYIHPETHRLHACGYIVTYDEILPEGVESTPEHILVYDAWETVEGLLVPTAISIYEEDKTPYYGATVADWSFRQDFDRSRLDMPENAVVDRSKP